MCRLILRGLFPACLIVTLVVLAASARAQTLASAAISGTVTDVTGAAVVGATVTVTNEATGVTRTVRSNQTGLYSVEPLTQGQYTVTASKAGFQKNVVRSIQIDAGMRRAINLQLNVGNTTAQVTVNADTVQVNTQTSDSSGTVTSKQVSNLMLDGRNFQTLAIQIPGVSSTNAASELQGGGINGFNTLIVNGQGVEYSTYDIDGVYDVNTGNLSNVNILPIVDGISEMRVLKDNYGAEYGVAGGGEILIETKSGTSNLHGSAWDYLRNNAFDANNYFSTVTPALHQNIFGFTFGGPLKIPKVYNTRGNKKTFFFTANQWYLITAGQTIRSAVFPQAMRTGDFSASPTLKGNLRLDANSQSLLAAEGKSNCILGPKTLNPSCFDPVAVAIMNKYWPLPNNLTGGFDNYLNQASATTNEGDYQYRVDHTINQANQIMARVNYEQVKNLSPDGLAWGGNPSPLISYTAYTTGLNAVARLTTDFTPNVINTFSWGQTFTKALLSETAPLPSGLTIKQAFPGADLLNRIPNIGLAEGWAATGVSGLPIKASDGEGIPTDDLIWVKGNHVIQMGAMYIFGIKRQTAFATPEGAFFFTGVHTGDPAADYLLGLDSTYSQVNTQRRGYFHYRQGEAYVQDNWHATPRLNVNLGVRWSYFSNDTASGDEVTGFSPALYSAAQAPVVNRNGSLVVNSSNVPLNTAGQPANPLNGIIFAGQNGVPSGFFIPKKDNFGPRIGFAYDVSGNGTTTLRGGYGIAYSRDALVQLNAAYGQNLPYVRSANIINSLLSDATAGTPKAPTIEALNVEPNTFVPVQLQTYSLTLEHQVTPNAVASLAYVGSQGRHLESVGFNTNFPLPVASPSLSTCVPASQSPSSLYQFDPCINTGVASPYYTAPYQGYSAINTEYDDGSDNYNALQAGLVYRLKASQLNLAYTYSKVLGTIGTHGAGQGSPVGAVVQNPRNVHAEYGPPDYDFTQDFTGTWVYSIPFFRNASAPLKWGLADWNFAGLALLQSGFALSPGMATSTAGLAIRPNQVAPIRRVGKVKQWFSTGSFAAPAYGFFGDAANGTIRGPSLISFNVGLYKTFLEASRMNLQFRAEAFNIANHPNLTALSTSLGAGNYGQITGALDPRILEFALKLTF